MKMMIMRLCLVLSCVFLLSACFPVKNENGYWAKGFIDVDLVGDWLDEDSITSGFALSSTPKLISVRPVNDDYLQVLVEGKEKYQVKTLMGGNEKFLLVRFMDEKGQTTYLLLNYKQDRGKMVSFDLDSEKADIKQKYFKTGQDGDEPLPIDSLNDTVLNDMGKTFARADVLVKQWTFSPCDKACAQALKSDD